MNKYIFIFILLFISKKGLGQRQTNSNQQNIVNTNQQDIVNRSMNAYNVSSPNVTSFQKVNNIATNEYTGRAEINIPLYEVKSGDITVPISLSYNTSGVKVNDIPSSVGCNWSLNAGGNVSKIVKDREDFNFLAESSEPSNSTVPNSNVLGYYTAKALGWFYLDDQKNNVNFKNIIQEALPFLLNANQEFNFSPFDIYESQTKHKNDKKPDLFIANAPGLNSRFIHKKDKTPWEINAIGNSIKTSFGNTNTIDFFDFQDGWGGLRKIRCINNIEITSPEGFGYTFSELDISQNACLSFSPIESSPVYRKNRYFVYPYDQVDTYHLSKIKSALSKKEVTFEYEKYALDDVTDLGFWVTQFEGRYFSEPNVSRPYGISYLQRQHAFPQLNRLKKILFEQGSVEFVYNLDRLDLIGDKALTQIIIKDFNQRIVRTISLEYDYFISGDNCNDPNCKRLRLDKISLFDENGVESPNYKFTYNETKLPQRNAYNQDFLGYANTEKGEQTFNHKTPILYYAPDKGNMSLVPFSLGNEYTKLVGDYSLESNLEYTKAGILTKIQYPTGAVTEFDYELNSFMLNSKEIKGGGLRIKSQHIYDLTGLGREQRKDYFYTVSSGESSGRLNNIPYYGNIKTIKESTTDFSLPNLIFDIYTNSRSMTEIVDDSYIGYSKVKSKDIGVNNGYVENTYTSSEDFPNLEAKVYKTDDITYKEGSVLTELDFTSESWMARAHFYYKNGGFGDLSVSQGIFRGKLKEQTIYDALGYKVETKEIGYTNKVFEIFPFVEIKRENDFINTGNNEGRIFDFIQKNDYVSQRYLKTYEKNIQFFENETKQVKTESQTIYHPTYQVPKEQSQINNANEELTTTYFYPDEINDTAISKLIDNNIYTTVIQTENRVNNKLINSNRTNYKDWGNDYVLPLSIGTSKEEDGFEERVIFKNYYPNGNIQEIHKKDGIHIVYIWGYNETTPIAKIENATYSQIASYVTNLQLKSNADDDRTKNYEGNEGLLRSDLDALRIALPQAMVTTYTYDPLIGVTSITDANSETVYYEYDSYNRLEVIKNKDGHILKRYCYNYQGQLVNDCEEANTGNIDDSAVSIEIGSYQQYAIPIVYYGILEDSYLYRWCRIPKNESGSYHKNIYFGQFNMLAISDGHLKDYLFDTLPEIEGGYNLLPRVLSDYTPHLRAYRYGYSYKINGLNSLDLNDKSRITWSIELNGKKYPLPKIKELNKVFFIPSCLNNSLGRIVCEIYNGDTKILEKERGGLLTPSYTYKSDVMSFKANTSGYKAYDKTTFVRVYSDKNDEGYYAGLETDTVVDFCPCHAINNK